MQNRALGIGISISNIIIYAQSKFIELANKNSSTLYSWCNRLLLRNGFSIRRASHLDQPLPKKHDFLVKKFLKEVQI